VCTAATLSTPGQALQQCGAFSHGATRLVRLRVDVAVDACLIDLERCPIDETWVMFGKKYGPLGNGQTTTSPPERSLFIDVTFMTRFSVGVSASIHRIREDMMDRGSVRSSGSRSAYWIAAGTKDPRIGTTARPYVPIQVL
jgi:hypothetical protein